MRAVHPGIANSSRVSTEGRAHAAVSDVREFTATVHAGALKYGRTPGSSKIVINRSE